ncbi:MAG: histidine phosphatase family protein [Spirochaetes bacterium]|nr:histidine phosphatase family protein [Spirochaetota bacterium]
MELHLMRHGKTSANEQGLYCGQTDLPLSPTGIAQIESFKDSCLYPQSPALFFSSHLIRAVQTIDIIYGKVRVKTLPEIAEFHFGDFEMHSHEELKNRGDYRLWIADKTGAVPCPGGESKQQFEKRVIAGYNNIVSEVNLANCACALVVCHGGIIACLMEHLCPGTKGFYEWQPAQGRGYTLVYAGGQLQEARNL